MKRTLVIILLAAPVIAFSLSDVAETFSPHGKLARARQSGPGPSLVSVVGRQLVVRKRNPDGSLAPAASYTVRGVDWSPAGTDTNTTPQDPNNASVRRAEFHNWYTTDIPLIKNMNVNTVFTYLDPPLDSNGTDVLDLLYNNGIMVVMTVDEGINNTTRVQQAVNFYKNHPAILAWNLGNEWNINFYFTSPPITASQAAMQTQTAAALIKTLDTNHPVVTSYGDIDINDPVNPMRRLTDTQHYVNDICTSVDVWALNIFRGSNFGTLFDQWKAITNKPMLVGEFGTDAFRSYNQNQPPDGAVDEQLQADWDITAWNHLARNLSANHPGRVAAGGFVFAWNDEWWKVSPYDAHQANGCNQTLCGGHPDNFGNEEYFGVVALNPTNVGRTARAAYGTLTSAFAPAYQPPANRTEIFRASSAGTFVPNTSCGFGRFYKGTVRLFNGAGCSTTGGRGFNVAVFDPCTGELVQQPQNYDTWGTRDSGTQMTALTNFLNGLPNGVLVLLAVGDEAGLTQFNNCTHLPYAWIEPFYQSLEALGSTMIRSYCYRDSWAMAAIKGNPATKVESLKTNQEASAHFTLSIQSNTSPSSRSFSANAGAGAIAVSVPGGCNWSAASNDAFITINSGSSGTGNGVVTYSVAINTGPVRTGTMNIAGQLFTVTQAQPGSFGGRTPFNFDYDAKTDLAFWRPSNGTWQIINSSTSQPDVQGWGVSGDQIVPGDYDGDANIDLAIWRQSAGTWFIVNSSNDSVTVRGWGTSGDAPVPSDYDGDGKADIAVWRQSAGAWFIINSSDNSVRVVPWGVSGDVPAPGDYDGDGRSDIAVWRPAAAAWFILNSSDSSVRTVVWGTSEDKPVPGDYDADGRSDIAVWRPSNGTWYVINSFNNSIATASWGVSSDRPVPGDYDGDGKTDMAVWRPSSGVWFIINSSNGSIRTVSFGAVGDVAVPSAYIRM